MVSEKTGYPVDSLDLSMSLDSDLGVDSIKRVEILSALQERLPDAPVVKPEHLGTLHTLRDVADFLAGSGSQAPAPIELPASDEDDALVRTMPVTADQLELLRSAPGDIAGTLLAVVSEKTGYPVDSLDLSMSLDSDLGVDSIKRVEILSALQERLPDAPVVKPEHLGTLHTLRDVADFLGPQAAPTTKITIPLVEVSENMLTNPVTPQMDVQPATAEPPPDTVQMSGPQPPKVSESAINGTARPSAGAIPRPPARQPNETVRLAVAPFGTDRIDRSIPQVVDLDLGAPRTRIAAPRGRRRLAGR